jgi:hypothetical protein
MKDDAKAGMVGISPAAAPAAVSRCAEESQADHFAKGYMQGQDGQGMQALVNEKVEQWQAACDYTQ